MVNDLDAYLIIQHKRKVFVNKISVQHLQFNEQCTLDTSGVNRFLYFNYKAFTQNCETNHARDVIKKPIFLVVNSSHEGSIQEDLISMHPQLLLRFTYKLIRY